MAEFRMPSLGADMRAGTLVEWKVKPGDAVKSGDIIADVETDKGIMEIEVFEDGIVSELLIEPSTKVPVGTAMAMIQTESPAEATVSPATPPVPVTPTPRAPESSSPPPEPVPSSRLRISPFARKLAAELGVDLQQIRGTGPEGAIQQKDIEQAAARIQAPSPGVVKRDGIQPKPPTPTAGAPPTDFQAGMRRAIAAAMSRANQEIPHYYLETEIDMSSALQWLEAENQKRSMKDRMLPVVLLIKAVALALVDVPELNGYWINDQLQVQESIHIGFAISLRQGGLVTPALHHADLKSLDELMVAMRDLITRTRAGRLRSSELSDATLTLTSLGDMGVEKVYGVIYPPQVALVGFGKIAPRPWVEQGMIGIRPGVTATLAGDHRASDGMVGARFLQSLKGHLQQVDKF